MKVKRLSSIAVAAALLAAAFYGYYQYAWRMPWASSPAWKFAEDTVYLAGQTKNVFGTSPGPVSVSPDQLLRLLKANGVIPRSYVRGDALVNRWGTSIGLEIQSRLFIVKTSLPLADCEDVAHYLGQFDMTIRVNTKEVKKKDALGTNLQALGEACRLGANDFVIESPL